MGVSGEQVSMLHHSTAPYDESKDFFSFSEYAILS
jgi:hypothetical protein